MPAVEPEVAEEPDAAEADAAKADVTDSAETEPSETEDDGAPKMKFREDMLGRVMKAAGIDAEHRDGFVEFAADYDHDDNGYLKKAELEDAAKAWQEAHAGGDAEAQSEAAPEASGEEASADGAGEKACMICDTMVPADAATCSACGFAFIDV